MVGIALIRNYWSYSNVLCNGMFQAFAGLATVNDITSLLDHTAHIKVLYCIALYCTVLYCTVLYCTVLQPGTELHHHLSPALPHICQQGQHGVGTVYSRVRQFAPSYLNTISKTWIPIAIGLRISEQFLFLL